MKRIIYAVLILFFLLLFSCSSNQRSDKSIESMICDSITALFGEYNLDDSTSVLINNNFKYHVWFVTRRDTCPSQLFVFKEINNHLYLTDTNDYLVDCWRIPEEAPILETEGKNVGLYLTSEDYIFNFDSIGAYVDTINFYRKFWINDNECVLEIRTLTSNDYGKVRVKDATETFFDKLLGIHMVWYRVN